ncbi:MAG: (2E,6E)-farnesyl diphosphate synthase [Pseudomonadota bacterium]
MSLTLRTSAERVEAALAANLPATDVAPQRLHQAMRYATLDGGKRVRPYLVYACGEALGAPLEWLDAPAMAVECIHVYSLVHDDLPAMDDDDLRRGRPTCHKAYDEATAILVGDALQAHAFTLLAGNTAVPAERRLAMVAALSDAAGAPGMVGGQALDIDAVGRDADQATLEAMHRRKTGALIRASAALGALAADADDDALAAVDRYAAGLGLAFQIQDDILDVTGDAATLGKAGGADAARDKPTYPALLGLDGAREHAATTAAEAEAALNGLGPTFEPLRELVRYVIERDH